MFRSWCLYSAFLCQMKAELQERYCFICLCKLNSKCKNIQFLVFWKFFPFLGFVYPSTLAIFICLHSVTDHWGFSYLFWLSFRQSFCWHGLVFNYENGVLVSWAILEGFFCFLFFFNLKASLEALLSGHELKQVELLLCCFYVCHISTICLLVFSQFGVIQNVLN